MAITRTQIAKQLLAQGGRTGFQGGGADMGQEPDSQGNVGGGFGDNRDRGRERSMQAAQSRADARVAAGLGDPDPNVDKPVDTITSFRKNLGANLRANPFSLITPLGTVFQTAYQTGKARLMLGLQNPGAPGITGEDAGQDIPYWAQLGFSSEEEYLASLRAQAPSNMDQEPEIEEDEGLRRRFRAEGGIMNNDVVGGEFDFESARQMYGLGKLVKKVTRTVKKIAKSPIGKVAIAAGIAGIPFGGGKFFGSGSLFGKAKTFFGPGSFNPLKRLVPGVDKDIALSPFGELFSKIPGGGVTAAIAGTSLLAGLLTPAQEEEAQELSRGEGIDIDAARNAILAARQDDFRARRFRAEGGSMKEPVAKKTMPLLDLDGKEMDLRAEGGFVPIGRMEKADDVPARLSKNEFVFTADAVRNAGDGNVDKGAEVMYNMMKNLEAGGEVSKESQGLEGARRMFQTSKRLEEVL